VHQCKLIFLSCFVLEKSDILHDKISNVSESEGSNKSADLTGKKTPTSWLNTQLEIPEQCGQFIDTATESAQSLDVDVALQSNIKGHSVQHDVLERSNLSSPLDLKKYLPLPTSLPHEAYDLNVFNVEFSGHSTYDDIVSILKVLEQEETHSREF
jgi:hypothetical protein